MQLWTQPLWLLLLIAPYIAVLMHEQDALPTAEAYFWIAASGQGFNLLLFGSATTVAFSMVAQIGEQVDFLRFMPEKTEQNKVRWWLATISAGPGWILFGMLRQLGGALLAHLAIRHGISAEHAHEPTQMYLIAYNELLPNAEWALAATTLFVVISQLKINVTNAYAGSLAWSNFFSRITHSHPGRVVWLIFNVSISLLLMEFGVFSVLEKVLGLFSNMSIAWISAVAAELMINKPLNLSPNIIEFKRAYLPDLNPVGIIATFVASLVSILAYIGLFGEYAQAFSAFISLTLAFILVPLIAFFAGHKHYLARNRNKRNSRSHNICCICENEFEHEDIAYCPAYNDSICSLCCTLDARCLDACKPNARLDYYLETFARRFMSSRISLTARLRLLRFALLFCFLSVLTSIFIGIIYYQDLLVAQSSLFTFQLLSSNFIKVYSSLLVFIGLCTWWLILNDESRRVAHEETGKQTQLLLMEIEEHKKTDTKLAQALKMADSANSAKSRFLSNMSHEIRTPLNSIIGYSYILHKDPSIPEHRRQAVDTLKRSGEHLSALIEDILDIARIEARKFELNYEPLNFHEFIEHLVRIYKVQAEDKGLLFRCQIVNTLPQQVRADEKRVGQILINILSNAIKFTQSGEIVIRVGYSSGVATFHIIDTGQGIAPEQLQEIFQPFTRLNTTTGNAISGSGLGLTISKILAEIMGGDLAVSSELGKGTTFTVRLFLPNLGAMTEFVPQENIVGYRGRRQKILIVDDQPEHRDVMRSILEPLGFIVHTASSGAECLEQAQNHKPDLILLDLTMPVMNGTATAIQLRKNSFLKPIIVLSANAYPEDRVAAIQAGCNDFLAKPVQVHHLLAKLKLHTSLTWNYQTDEADNSEVTENELQLPPADIIQSLQALVRIGDLLGLNKKLEELVKKNPEYLPLSQRIKVLTSEFRLAEIKKLLV
jgi:signal transduction histidine kinase/CheY-like chemotaxis protein